jgi:hypothetical protein
VRPDGVDIGRSLPRDCGEVVCDDNDDNADEDDHSSSDRWVSGSGPLRVSCLATGPCGFLVPAVSLCDVMGPWAVIASFLLLPLTLEFSLSSAEFGR